MPQTVSEVRGDKDSMADVCARVGGELDRLSVIALQLEASLGSVAVGEAIDETRLHDLQQLDALSQHLAALRDFMVSLANVTLDEVDLGPALRLVSLEAMRARLAGEARISDPSQNVELFR